MLEFKRYMKAVKRELSFEEHDLVFIGMADVSLVRWCEQKSVFKNKEMELNFFMSSLIDILEYAKELGYISVKMEPPPEKLLELRSKISFDDIEKILSKRKAERASVAIEIPMIEGLDEDKIRKLEDLFLKGATPTEFINQIRTLCPTISSTTLGEILECYKERYPTVRWNFDWEDYVVIGVPDGITDRFVYEYKTTGNMWLLRWMKPVAMTQADLYGYFFKRKEKRVQIMTRDDGTIHTWHEKVDTSSALDALKRFKEVERGARKPIPPARWKCRLCEFKERCEIKT